MSIVGQGNETYLYVNGIKTNHELSLNEHVTLLPVSTCLDFTAASKLIDSDIDYSIAVLSSVNIQSQIRICTDTIKDTTAEAWNAQWDCLLLGALFNNNIMSSIQCDKPVELLSEAQYLHVTNYTLHGLMQNNIELKTEDEDWIKKHYFKAHMLLDKSDDSFHNAVHCMGTHLWHSLPRVQLAILWAGIESLFNVSNEVSFRVSLCVAHFLYPDDRTKAKECYQRVKKLYDMRSSAVHGNKMKESTIDVVKESARLLNTLIRRCAELGDLPDTKELIY